MSFFTTINSFRFSLILSGLVTLVACGDLEEIANQAPTASSVSITDNNGGSAILGDILTGSYVYADEEGDAEGITSQQWLRDAVAIDGATTDTYTLVLDDVGTGITYRVTPFATTGTATGIAVTSNVKTVINRAPVVSDVVIAVDGDGIALVAKTLIGSYAYADIEGDVEGITTFKWLRNNVEIVGATNQSYILVAEDSTTDITLEVIPVAVSGTLTGVPVISNEITVVNSVPTASDVNIAIDNGTTPLVGGGLTGIYTFDDIDNDEEGTSTFRWLRGSTPITGATGISYTLVTADIGPVITFEVIPVAVTGNTIGNAVTATISGENTAPAISVVTIIDTNGGSVVVGDVLTGGYTYVDIDGDADSSTFRWLRGGVAIAGATAQNYTLVTADIGSVITFEVMARAASGVISGNAATADITVVNVLMSLVVTPADPSIALGTDQQFTAIGTYSDATTQNLTSSVVWSSNNTAVVTISNAGGSEGLASSVAVGTVTVTATDTATGINSNASLTVSTSTLVSLAVTPTNPSIALGTDQQFTAIGTYSDATTQNLTSSVVWSSNNTAVVTISNAGGSEGLASSVATGAVTVTATDSVTGINGNTSLIVSAATLVSLAVTPNSPSIALGTSQQFTATGFYTDGSTQDVTSSVTWSTPDTAIATISNAGGSEGLASSVATGTVTVTATDSATGINGNTSLIVSAATLVSVAVTPANPSIALGTGQQFTATGTYTDASTQDLTTSVTWSSSNAGIATVSNAGGSEGLASSVATGTVTVTATDSATGINGNTSLIVSAATLVSVAVTPANPSIALGTGQQFTATGTYTDASIQNLTLLVPKF